MVLPCSKVRAGHFEKGNREALFLFSERRYLSLVDF